MGNSRRPERSRRLRGGCGWRVVFEAGIVCELQEEPNCERPLQEDARGTRAPQLLTGRGATLALILKGTVLGLELPANAAK